MMLRKLTLSPRSGPTRAILAAAFGLVALSATAPAAQAWEMRVCADPNRLPFSHIDQTGFENRIAAALAKRMGAELTFDWFPQSEAMNTEHLRVGECDLIMGVPDGTPTMTSTLAYYRSPFVFIQRADKPFHVEMFDDPVLKDLKIGVQPPMGPTHDALTTRGLANRIERLYDYELTPIIEDVAKGDIDVGVLWGPAAGFYGALQDVPMEISPVTPEFEPPFIPMFLNIVIGLRRGEESFRDLLNVAISESWEEINEILAEYNMPLMPLPQPMLTLGNP